MDSIPSNSAIDLFDLMADLPASARARYIEQHCDDPGTRREVESLLLAHDDAGAFLADRREISDEVEPCTIGAQIGAYELLEQIGEGGFARVFRARQLRPIRREVALKLVKLGMDTRAVIARFELERQALAMMDHPNIAAVYDAGATDTGRPYFVMELVRGPRITRYCDENALDVRRRVGLFIDVCHAVQHAHTKGILHRDIKPSNLLVATISAGPVPKVIDFGIAKAVQQRLTEMTLVTQEQQLLGTPQYMSPEQARSGGTDVDTRSDIYSLGAVLFELLSGTPPLNALSGESSSPLDDLQRLTSDDELPRASARAMTLDRRRALRGELDWIVAKCLAKERKRRYDSAAALAADLQAYLDHRPVNAAPPTLAYQTRKFVRRNTAAVVAAAIVVATLISASAISTMLAVRAIRAERLAQKRFGEVQAANANLKAVNDFLTNDMIGAANPAVTQANRDMTVHEALDNAAGAVAQKLSDRPLVEAAVRDSLAWAYLSLGRPALALSHAESSLQIRRRDLGDDHPDTILAANIYGASLKALGRLPEAETVLKDNLERSRRVLGEEHLNTIEAMDNLANVLTHLGRAGDAEPLAKRAAELARRTRGEEDLKSISTTSNYARVLYRLGRSAETEPLLNDAFERSNKVRGSDHPETIALLNNRAVVLAELGRYDEAESLFKDLLDRRRRVMGEDHPETIRSTGNYGGLLHRMGRSNEAIVLIEDAVQRGQRALGEDHPEQITTLNNYAVVLQGAGRLAEAEAVQKQVLEKRRRIQGEDHPDTITALNNYAAVLVALDRHTEAEPLLKESLDRRRRILGPDHANTVRSTISYAEVLRVLGRGAEAEPLARESLAKLRKSIGDAHPDTLAAAHTLLNVIGATDRSAEAESLAAELYHRAADAKIAPRLIAQYQSHYGPCLVRLSRWNEAEAPLREAHRRLRETNQSMTPPMSHVLSALVEMCDHTNRPQEGARWRAELQSIPAKPDSSTQPATAPARPS